MPDEIELYLKNASKEYEKRCLVRKIPKKHKYCYILGRDNRETKYLHNIFKEVNFKLVGLEYPKRGG